ncbi:MAG: hypothetical protein K2X27_22780 [Candidatus Obscuribacterales bacterium]|nr:hypothetical protein [Candidatus Obscuribacterales bacterium]
MPRFFTRAMAHQNWLAEQADRSSSRVVSPKTDEFADLLPLLPVDEMDELKRRFCKGSKHKGSILRRASSGFVIDFGKLKGILPYNKTGGASLKVGDNVRVTVDDFDGSTAPRLTR